jgi:capsular exopolysaccharide synthesis family protein
MELRDYLAVLKRRWWQIILVALLTVGVALAASAVVPPRYDSQAFLRVIPSAPAQAGTLYESILTADLLAKTYRELFASDYIAIQAMRELGSDQTVREFKKHVSVELMPDTELLVITASAEEAQEARRIAEVMAQQAIAFVGNASRAETVTVEVPPLAPDRPTWPRPSIAVAAGLGFGLALGMALTLVFEYLGAKVERSSELEEKSGLVVLGQIPRIVGAGAHANVFAEANNPMAEHFRHLRTSVLYAMDSQKLDSLLVTSAEPKQGKTSIASNLAVALAKTGKHVLLVDADMRIPQVHEFFSLTNAKGLSEFLHGDVTFEDVLQDSGYDSLTVISAGQRPEEPAELLGSARLTEFLRQARAHADLLILDSPPAITVTDSVILAARVDGVLLVIDRLQRLETVRRVKSALSMVGANILGVAFNRAEVERGSSKSNYYYYVGGGSDSSHEEPKKDGG